MTEYLRTETGRISPRRYSPIFKAYVHWDKSLFKINSRWERVCGCYRRREIFFFLFIKSYQRIPKRKQKKTSCSKQGKYVRISGAAREQWLFQNSNNFRSSRKTISRISTLKKVVYINRFTFAKAKLEIFLLRSVRFEKTSDTVVFWIYFHKRASWWAKSVNISQSPNLVPMIETTRAR